MPYIGIFVWIAAFKKIFLYNLNFIWSDFLNFTHKGIELFWVIYSAGRGSFLLHMKWS